MWNREHKHCWNWGGFYCFLQARLKIERYTSKPLKELHTLHLISLVLPSVITLYNMHHQINLLGVSKEATTNIFEVKPVKVFKVEKKKIRRGVVKSMEIYRILKWNLWTALLFIFSHTHTRALVFELIIKANGNASVEIKGLTSSFTLTAF